MMSPRKFGKRRIDRAGKLLANLGSIVGDIEALQEQVEILDYFRAAHNYPLGLLRLLLHGKFTEEVDAGPKKLLVTRLKRRVSMIRKIARGDVRALSSMQDVGGARIVVHDIDRLHEVVRECHEFDESLYQVVGVRDYVSEPKEDGYRGVHIIYKFSSQSDPDFYGLKIELQVRTELQHSWATAVETVGLFEGCDLKSGEGRDEWRRFFKVASAAIACVEYSPTGYSDEAATSREIFKELSLLNESMRGTATLKQFAECAIINKGKEEKEGEEFFFIVTDSKKRTSRAFPFPSVNDSEVHAMYSRLERIYSDRSHINVVLVSAEKLRELNRAYPNYFFDASRFISTVEGIISSVSV